MDCLEGECVAYLYVSVGVSILAYLSPMGWHGIYSVFIPNWWVRIFSHWMK